MKIQFKLYVTNRTKARLCKKSLNQLTLELEVNVSESDRSLLVLAQEAQVSSRLTLLQPAAAAAGPTTNIRRIQRHTHSLHPSVNIRCT